MRAGYVRKLPPRNLGILIRKKFEFLPEHKWIVLSSEDAFPTRTSHWVQSVPAQFSSSLQASSDPSHVYPGLITTKFVYWSWGGGGSEIVIPWYLPVQFWGCGGHQRSIGDCPWKLIVWHGLMTGLWWVVPPTNDMCMICVQISWNTCKYAWMIVHAHQSGDESAHGCSPKLQHSLLW